MVYSKPILKLLLLSACAFSTVTHAQQSSEKNALGNDADRVQIGLIWLGGHIDTLTNRVDDFFAPEQTVEPGKAQLKLSLAQHFSKHYPANTKLNLSVNARLPRIEERLNLYIESFADDDVQDQTGTPQPKTDQSSDQFIGIASVFKLSDYIGWKNRAGTRMTSGQFDPYVTSQLRFETDIDKRWFVNFEPGLFWQRVMGTGHDASLNFAHKYTDKDFFRLSSFGLKYHEEDDWQLHQSLEWLHRASDKNRFSTQMGRQWHWNESTDLITQDSYFQINWRHRLYKQWLYLSVTPGVHAPLDLDYQTNPFINVGFEAFSRNTQL